jgi:hypothetical protein
MLRLTGFLAVFALLVVPALPLLAVQDGGKDTVHKQCKARPETALFVQDVAPTAPILLCPPLEVFGNTVRDVLETSESGA